MLPPFPSRGYLKIMNMIDGKKIATRILADLKTRPIPSKFFAGILVGTDPASESFQILKQRTARELGIDYRIYRFSEDLGNDMLREEVRKVAEHATCGGVVVQLPLPAGVNKHYVLNAIPREKDPDVLSERSLGAFYAGRNPVLHPAAAVVKEVLKAAGFDLRGKRAVVVGPGFLVGRPVALWLLDRAAEVVVLGRDADRSVLQTADLAVLGVGQAGVVRAEELRPAAGVVDFGYSEDDAGGKKLVGDLAGDPSALSFYTPTPGGTGPILVAKLFENFYTLTERK